MCTAARRLSSPPKFHPVFFRHRSATTIFAALLLTANLQSLGTLHDGAYHVGNKGNNQVSLVATFFFCLASATALCSIFIGTWHVLTAVRYGKDIVAAISVLESKTPGFFKPALQALLSAWSTVMGICSLVYLLQGGQGFAFAISPMVAFFLVATVIGVYTGFYADEQIKTKADDARQVEKMLLRAAKNENASEGIQNAKAYFTVTALKLDKASIKEHLEYTDTDISNMEEGATNGASRPICGTPLIFAAAAGNEELVNLLLKKGANVNAADMQGRTALSFAAENNDKKVAALLIQAGANMELKRFDGLTPAYVAADKGNVDVLALLLHYGANSEVLAKDGLTAFAWVARKEKMNMYLTEGGPAYWHTLNLLAKKGANKEAEARDVTLCGLSDTNGLPGR